MVRDAKKLTWAIVGRLLMQAFVDGLLLGAVVGLVGQKVWWAVGASSNFILCIMFNKVFNRDLTIM